MELTQPNRINIMAEDFRLFLYRWTAVFNAADFAVACNRRPAPKTITIDSVSESWDYYTELLPFVNSSKVSFCSGTIKPRGKKVQR